MEAIRPEFVLISVEDELKKQPTNPFVLVEFRGNATPNGPSQETASMDMRSNPGPTNLSWNPSAPDGMKTAETLMVAVSPRPGKLIDVSSNVIAVEVEAGASCVILMPP